MSTVLIDRIGAVVLQNGVMRIDCVAAGPNSEERPSGTLLIPASQAGTVLQSLVGAAQELDRRIREQVQQNGSANAAAAPADAALSKPAAKPSKGGKDKTETAGA
jgi:hypothetical protein